MSNPYIPEPVPTAVQYKRYSQVQMPRAHGGIPYIRYREEHVVSNENGEVITPAGEVNVGISSENENEEFTIIDPVTKTSAGGVMTYGELLQALDSFYYHLAVKRDKEENTTESSVKGRGIHNHKVDKKL
jgi:hypothetical protein